MKYLAIVHHESDSAYGITLPDFPGCFSAADTFEGIPAAVQEAVEVWAEGEKVDIPAPSGFEAVRGMEEANDGMLMLVDVNFDFMDKKTVPVNITMPAYMRERIDRQAKALGMSRSGYLLAAAQAYRPATR